MTPNGRQIERMASLLRDVRRSGGVDNWPHLASHGHVYATVQSAIRRGYLRETRAYHYEVTDDAAAFFTWHALWSKVKDD